MLSVEFGHFLLIIAIFVAATTAFLPLTGIYYNNKRLQSVSDPGSIVLFLLIATAFAILLNAFVVSDFSLKIVWQNSNDRLPLLFRVAGTWGNHEGSMLLWTLILTGFSAFIALVSNNVDLRFKAATLAIQAIIALSFLVFIVFNSNPFVRLYPAPVSGMDLNPILQDVGLALHPPLLYIGYVGFSTAFSFALGALLTGNFDRHSASLVRPWAMISWVALTMGIAAGSYWAYYELGWGSWWFWDPVENASLLPWLIGTALLHSLAVTRKRDGLKIWSVFLAIMVFALSLLGTFLVRSGVLISVHTFANDPDRGIFILAILLLLIGGAFIIFAIMAPRLITDKMLRPLSRGGMIVINNLLLASATIVVLTGTLYPILIEVITGAKISVGPPFYNLSFVPIAAAVLMLMPLGSLLGWGRTRFLPVLTGLAVSIGFGLLLTVILLFIIGSYKGIIAFATVLLGLWTIITSAYQLTRKAITSKNRNFITGIRSFGSDQWAMTLAHIGLGVTALGIAVSTYWSQSDISQMKINDQRQVGPYMVRMVGDQRRQGNNFIEQAVSFEVSADYQTVKTTQAAVRFYPIRKTVTNEYGIINFFPSQVYVVVATNDTLEDGHYNVRIWYKPFIVLIWLGGLIMAGGGSITLLALALTRIRKMFFANSDNKSKVIK